MNLKHFNGGADATTYTYITSLSPQMHCSTSQEYYSLHCTCIIPPAPRVRAEDGVCYAEFLCSSATNDKCLRFRCL